VALKNALKLKELNPAAQVTILYRDMRVYGFQERLYTEARRAGVLFVRYEPECKPQVGWNGKEQLSGGAGEQGGEEKISPAPLFPRPPTQLEVQVWEPQLGREITLQPDLVVLSMPMVPAYGSAELARRLKVGVDLDGWLMEAHVKLRPVDFSTEGLYMAGSAHYPKLLGETIAQAQAAAARAATLLTRETLAVGGMVAEVAPAECVGCLTCMRVCPYHVPQIRPSLTGVGQISGAAFIEPAQCQGCGICVAECPAQAIQLEHYQRSQVEAKLEALLEVR
jgi:heterodisulfide reductase subunit A-like polyferredoxin